MKNTLKLYCVVLFVSLQVFVAVFGASGHALSSSNLTSKLEVDKRYTPSYEVVLSAEGGIFELGMGDYAFGVVTSLKVRVVELESLPVVHLFNNWFFDGELELIAPKRQDWNFDGMWSTQSGQGGVQVYDKFMQPAIQVWDLPNETLYARWVKPLVRVELNKNGGTGGDDFVLAIKDEILPTIASAPTRQGYVFDGYSSSLSSEGIKFYDKSLRALKNWESIGGGVLYADWISSKSVVFFNANGGEFNDWSTVSVEALYGYPMPAMDNLLPPTKDNEYFAGFFDTANEAGGKMYYDSRMRSINLFDREQSMVLYARWYKKKTTVLLDLQGGEIEDVPSDALNLTVDGFLNLPLVVDLPVVKSGFMFLGFYEGVNGAGVRYTDGTLTQHAQWSSEEADATIFAHFTEEFNVVVLDKNGGDGANVELKAKQGEPLKVDFKVPSREGFEFLGFFDGLGESAKPYFDANLNASVPVWDKNSDTILYARWQDTWSDFVLDGNGVELEYNRVYRAQYGHEVPDVNIIPPKRTGYDFLGFWNAADGEAIQYYNHNGKPRGVWNERERTTLYARWQMQTFNVFFYLDYPNSPVLPTLNVGYGQSFKKIYVPSIPDFEFLGFFDNLGVQYIASDGSTSKLFDKLEDLILYAKYKKIVDDNFNLRDWIIYGSIAGGVVVLLVVVVVLVKKSKNKQY